MKLIAIDIITEDSADDRDEGKCWHWKDVEALFTSEDIVSQEIATGDSRERSCKGIRYETMNNAIFIYIAPAEKWLKLQLKYRNSIRSVLFTRQKVLKVYVTRYNGLTKTSSWQLAFLVDNSKALLREYQGFMINLAARQPDMGDFAFSDEEKIAIITEKTLKGDFSGRKTY